jgi:glycosyltransferase involved in cell wall biosynthesis
VSPLRLVLDARTLTAPKTGDRTVTLGLLQGLAEVASPDQLELHVVTRDPVPAGLVPPAPHLHCHQVRGWPGYGWMVATFPAICRRLRAEVALVQYMAAPRLPCPFITLVHDTVWRTMPETFPRRARMILDTFLPGTLRRAALIAAPTSFSVGELQHHFPFAAHKTRLLPYGVESIYRPQRDPARLAAVKAKYHLPDRFILSVGVLQPRKNVTGLMQAYTLLPPELRDQTGLVITGKQGWLADNLPDLAAAAGPGVQFTGYVDDAELPTLYTLADCLAYPSYYEGFGLPPLEAMACGTPVVTSTAPALVEVTGQAALHVPADDTPALAATLHRLLTDSTLRHRLVTAGLSRAAQFT